MIISTRRADLLDTIKEESQVIAHWFFDDDRTKTMRYDASNHAVTNRDGLFYLLADMDQVFMMDGMAVIVDHHDLDRASGHQAQIGDNVIGNTFYGVNVEGMAIIQTVQPTANGGHRKLISPLEYLIAIDDNIVKFRPFPVTRNVRRADLLDKFTQVFHQKDSPLKLSELRPGDVGRAIYYLPQHAHGDINHADKQWGNISSWNHKFVFVDFGKGDTHPACDPGDLYWVYNSHSK